MNYISKILEELKQNSKNTGSSELQITLASHKIHNLAQHLKNFRKDHMAKKSLLSYVNKRKKIIKYYAKKDISKANKLMKKFNIKKI